MNLLPDGGEIFVTWNQFSAIKTLALECERFECFDDSKWISGLMKILGDKFPKKYRSYKLIAYEDSKDYN